MSARREARKAGLMLLGLILALVLGPGVSTGPAGQDGAAPDPADWPQFNFDPSHSGFNRAEKTLGIDTVKDLRRLFRVELPDVADGAPILAAGMATAAGARDVLFVATKAGHLAALDARTGSRIWVRQNPAGPCRVNNGRTPCYTTSSPALDPGRGYVYAYGLDGRAHKYRATDGGEVTGGGWPQPATLKPFNEKGSSALSLAVDASGRGFLYVAHGGYIGDRGDYQGHLTTIEIASGEQRVFNAVCSQEAVHFEQEPGRPDCPEVQSAIWARAGSVYVPGLDRVLVATGNGTYEPRRHHWGDSVLALGSEGTGARGDPLDSYTPADFERLDDHDLDLGSTAPALLPVPQGCAVRYLGIQSGKDRLLRLLNMADLSGRGGPGHTGGEIGPVMEVPQGGMVLTAPAVWVDPRTGATWTFVANWNGISGLRLVLGEGGLPRLVVGWRQTGGATSPVAANGVLYAAGSRSIRALDALTGRELWRDETIGGIHWQSPIVVNGVLYIADEAGNLTAYSISR